VTQLLQAGDHVTCRNQITRIWHIKKKYLIKERNEFSKSLHMKLKHYNNEPKKKIFAQKKKYIEKL